MEQTGKGTKKGNFNSMQKFKFKSNTYIEILEHYIML